MHRTDTLDMFTVAYGEIYLVTDTDETLLRPGDTAVVQGVDHASTALKTAQESGQLHPQVSIHA